MGNSSLYQGLKIQTLKVTKMNRLIREETQANRRRHALCKDSKLLSCKNIDLDLPNLSIVQGKLEIWILFVWSYLFIFKYCINFILKMVLFQTCLSQIPPVGSQLATSCLSFVAVLILCGSSISSAKFWSLLPPVIYFNTSYVTILERQLDRACRAGGGP